MRLRPTLLLAAALGGTLFPDTSPAQSPTDAQRAAIVDKLSQLRAAVADLKRDRGDLRPVADVEVYAKAAEWILRHGEFYRPEYADRALAALQTGLQRAGQLAAGNSPWLHQPGMTVRGYYSGVDGSVQPYALTLPAGVADHPGKRWPLYVKLHGRAEQMNEVDFIHRYDGKPLPEGQDWIQLDVFGRMNNAYRFAGETDVFEAMADVSRTARVDSRRITLWGFSMGGAGAWHLGLHHPSKWSSVGAGAGFVDFYNYQKRSEPLPPYQHKTLGIYDALEYALNAFNVPFCTYGGELDPQLAASTAMVAAAQKLDVPIKLLIGPGTGHTFHPDSFAEFMAFHREHSEKGRPAYPGREEIRFTTRTVKYNECEWLSIEEMIAQYEPAVVTSRFNSETGNLEIQTENVAALQLQRDIASYVEIDGTVLPLATAAGGLLPGVYYEKGDKGWQLLDYEASRNFMRNSDGRKRRDLQGPIDDAFMQPFVCVRGTGRPWSAEHDAWARWTLERFEREFDKWMRGQVPIVDDSALGEALIAEKNLVLFGDPGSNSVLARILQDLPVQWDREGFEIGGRHYDHAGHGLALIYPNPLNPRRYVVLNSGHTFHEADFKASNAWLFPRLGDAAVQKFERKPDGSFAESVVWAELFDGSWRLPERRNE